MRMNAVVIPLLWQAAFFHFVNKRSCEEAQVICVSVFDGRPRRGRISDAFEHVTGRPAYSLDQKNDPKQDMSSMAGVQMFLDAMSRCAPNSLLWLAPECGSWVWVCWSTSGRRRNNPDGVPSGMTMQANRIAEFVARAILLATALGAGFSISIVNDSSHNVA